MTIFFLITEIAKYPFVNYNKRYITFYMIFFFFLGGSCFKKKNFVRNEYPVGIDLIYSLPALKWGVVWSPVQ